MMMQARMEQNVLINNALNWFFCFTTVFHVSSTKFFKVMMSWYDGNKVKY